MDEAMTETIVGGYGVRRDCYTGGLKNCGDPRESLIFQCFPDVGPVDTLCLGILCRLSARWLPLNEPTGRGAIAK